MKTWLLTLGLLLLAASCLAETRYVSDILIVTVRAQPSNGAELLTTVPTATPLEILADQGEFLHIRTDKGVEGYVRSQYVSKETPKAVQIRQLRRTNQQLQDANADLEARLAELEQQTGQLTSSNQELEKIRSDYLKLQKASDNVIQITRERDLLQQENSELTERMQQLKEENSLYLRTGVIKWFLAGAGVLFFGWLLGKVSRKKKRNYL